MEIDIKSEVCGRFDPLTEDGGHHVSVGLRIGLGEGGSQYLGQLSLLQLWWREQLWGQELLHSGSRGRIVIQNPL